MKKTMINRVIEEIIPAAALRRNTGGVLVLADVNSINVKQNK